MSCWIFSSLWRSSISMLNISCSVLSSPPSATCIVVTYCYIWFFSSCKFVDWGFQEDFHFRLQWSLFFVYIKLCPSIFSVIFLFYLFLGSFDSVICNSCKRPVQQGLIRWCIKVIYGVEIFVVLKLVTQYSKAETSKFHCY